MYGLTEPGLDVRAGHRVEKQGTQGCFKHDSDERATSESVHQASVDVVAVFDGGETDDERAECGGQGDIPAEKFAICHEKWSYEVRADGDEPEDHLDSTNETYDSEFACLVDEADKCKHSVEIAQPHCNGQGLWMHAVEPFTFVEILEGVIEHGTSFAGERGIARALLADVRITCARDFFDLVHKVG